MAAQIINLSDRRTRPTPPPSMIDLQLSFLTAYVGMSLAAYLSAVNAAEQGWKAASLSHDGFSFHPIAPRQPSTR